MYVMMENDLRFADIQICIKDQPTNGAVKLDLENNVVYRVTGQGVDCSGHPYDEPLGKYLQSYEKQYGSDEKMSFYRSCWTFDSRGPVLSGKISGETMIDYNALPVIAGILEEIANEQEDVARYIKGFACFLADVCIFEDDRKDLDIAGFVDDSEDCGHDLLEEGIIEFIEEFDSEIHDLDELEYYTDDADEYEHPEIIWCLVQVVYDRIEINGKSYTAQNWLANTEVCGNTYTITGSSLTIECLVRKLRALMENAEELLPQQLQSLIEELRNEHICRPYTRDVIYI